MLDAPDERDAIMLRISAIRDGASQLSCLLADGSLAGEEWDRAARILAGCRQERRVLETHLLRIEGSTPA